MVLSLTVNVLMLLLVSHFSQTRLGEWLESYRFLRRPSQPSTNNPNPVLSVQDGYLLVRRFAGEKEAKKLLQRYSKTMVWTTGTMGQPHNL